MDSLGCQFCNDAARSYYSSTLIKASSGRSQPTQRSLMDENSSQGTSESREQLAIHSFVKPFKFQKFFHLVLNDIFPLSL